MFDAFSFSASSLPQQPGVRNPAAGFSLIELLVVLAIMGILSVIALPSYLQHVQRGHRAEAVAALLEAQHFMERYYSAHGRYNGSANEPGKPPDLPVRLQGIPLGSELRYQLRLETSTVHSYGLLAEPVGSMRKDKCGTLTLNQTGLKGVTGSELDVADCWQ